jgi:dTDP-glucose 4,6-dehydratase
MKLLVTGGAGFIGSHFVEWTVKNRPDVDLIVLDKLTYASVVGKNTIEDLGVPLVMGDVSVTADVETVAKRVDAIVNFAAETHNDNSIECPDLFFRTNVQGTLELVKYASENGIRFHQVSTDEVFGDLPLNGKEKFTEQSPYKPSSPYSASKAAADHIVRAWTRTYGLKATISNCSNNYGSRQHPEKLIPKTINLIAAGKPPLLYGTGDNIRDWIHVEDHVLGVWAVLERGRIGETYLFGGGMELQNNTVVESIQKAMNPGAEVEIKYVVDRLGHDRRYAIDYSKALSELGWQPSRTNFQKEIEAIVAQENPFTA